MANQISRLVFKFSLSSSALSCLGMHMNDRFPDTVVRNHFHLCRQAFTQSLFYSRMQFYQLRLICCPGYADLFSSLSRCGLTSMGSWRIISNNHPTSFEFFSSVLSFSFGPCSCRHAGLFTPLISKNWISVAARLNVIRKARQQYVYPKVGNHIPDYFVTSRMTVVLISQYLLYSKYSENEDGPC